MAAFKLPEQVEGLTLPQSIRFVTSNPAKSANLNDRGTLAVGLRADMVQVRVTKELPVVKKVWTNGLRVM